MGRTARAWIVGGIALGVALASLAVVTPGPTLPAFPWGVLGAPCPPKGLGLAVSTPQSTRLGAEYRYNFTIRSMQNLSGCVFVLSGVSGGFSGSVEVAIP